MVANTRFCCHGDTAEVQNDICRDPESDSNNHLKTNHFYYLLTLPFCHRLNVSRERSNGTFHETDLFPSISMNDENELKKFTEAL